MTGNTKAPEAQTTEEEISLPPYAQEELDKMLPEYMAILDAGDEEGGLQYLKDQFTNRKPDILTFAGMVARLCEERAKDNAPEVAQEMTDDVNTGITDDTGAGEAEAPVAGQDDTVEQGPQPTDNV